MEGNLEHIKEMEKDLNDENVKSIEIKNNVSIVRISALKSAVRLAETYVIADTQELLQIAEIFECWLIGNETKDMFLSKFKRAKDKLIYKEVLGRNLHT